MQLKRRRWPATAHGDPGRVDAFTPSGRLTAAHCTRKNFPEGDRKARNRATWVAVELVTVSPASGSRGNRGGGWGGLALGAGPRHQHKVPREAKPPTRASEREHVRQAGGSRVSARLAPSAPFSWPQPWSPWRPTGMAVRGGERGRCPGPRRRTCGLPAVGGAPH